MENVCVCISDNSNDFCALVTPSDKQFKILARELNKSTLSREQLCRDPEVIDAVLQSIHEVARNAGLHRRETPVKIHLCAEDWLPDNGLLTAAFKLRRKNVAQFYAKEIATMMADLK